MVGSRRTFLARTALLIAGMASAKFAAAQGTGSGVPGAGNPIPGGPFGTLPAPIPRRTAAQQMKLNQAEIHKNMTKLKTAVAELEKELQSNDTTAVLSMSAVRKAEEIEKLARQIKGLVRG